MDAARPRGRVALTRAVPDSISRCELTHLDRAPIDLARASAQHAAYERTLETAGCTVIRLPSEPDLPDSIFVEDAAVVLDEIGVVTRPGAPSRRRETMSIGAVLRGYRPLRFIEPPATLDGGDVLRMGRRIFVGLSSRTTRDGVEQLKAIVTPFAYALELLEPRGCLHLKSAATAVADDTVLINPAWIDSRTFGALRTIEVDPREPSAANVLRIGSTIICQAMAPRTRDRLAARGLTVLSVDTSELAKAEGGLTCCCLVIEDS